MQTQIILFKDPLYILRQSLKGLYINFQKLHSSKLYQKPTKTHSLEYFYKKCHLTQLNFVIYNIIILWQKRAKFRTNKPKEDIQKLSILWSQLISEEEAKQPNSPLTQILSLI